MVGVAVGGVVGFVFGTRVGADVAIRAACVGCGVAVRSDTVEIVKCSTIGPPISGRFTQSICKMWVKDRTEGRGF
jgi:uncharacterized protein YcfJ